MIAARHAERQHLSKPGLRDDAMALKPEQLDAFLGQYQYAQVILTVTREGAQLLAQLGQRNSISSSPLMNLVARR